MKTSKKSGLTIKTNVKAGGLSVNHSRASLKKAGLAIKTNVKAGGLSVNHNRSFA
jgi:hypothetical protein